VVAVVEIMMVILTVCFNRECVAKFMKRRAGITVKAALLMQVTRDV
jgi:hypothetical protein